MRYLAPAAVALFVLAAPIRADEEKVPLDKAPKAVVEAAKKRFPKAEVVGVSKETADGKTVYEVELKLDGKTIDVSLTPEGVITLIEQQIDAKDLPKPVAEALEKKYAKATYKLIEAVYGVKDGKETLNYYEIHLVTAEKKEIEVEILADGKIKNEEEKKPEKKEEKKPGQCGEEKGEGKKGEKKDEDDEDDVELPKAVAKAVKSKFPGGKVVGASKEGKGEKAVYEVELRYKTGTLEVLMTSKGEVVEVELKGKKKEKDEDDEKGEKGEKENKKSKKKGEDDKEEKGKKKGEKEDRD